MTTEITGVPVGALMGRGPVAETFPDPLAPLEVDLWVPPLRDGLADALRLSATVPEREIEDRELVTVVWGWVALDLGVTGEVEDPELDHRGVADQEAHPGCPWVPERLLIAR